MESIQTRRFCCFPSGKKRREFFVPFACFVSFYLFGGRRKVVNNLIVSTSLSFFSSFFISDFSGRRVFVEYASERRRHKRKSFSHIGTRCEYLDSRVDFCKSNRSRVHERLHWNLGNRRGRNNKQPSHQTIQTRKRESKNLTIYFSFVSNFLFICWRCCYMTWNGMKRRNIWLLQLADGSR